MLQKRFIVIFKANNCHIITFFSNLFYNICLLILANKMLKHLFVIDHESQTLLSNSLFEIYKSLDKLANKAQGKRKILGQNSFLNVRTVCILFMCLGQKCTVPMAIVIQFIDKYVILSMELVSFLG